ncbi:MAG TPA: phage tail tip lysozyme [Candidatus Saccharimonadales bacterium]
MKYIQIKSTTKRIPLLIMVVLYASIPAMAGAQAFTQQDLKNINDQTAWYDPNFGGCTGGVDATTLVGNDNIEQTYNFFTGHGLTNFQSAGIVGNLMQESGVNPKSNQSGGGVGRGIAQWSAGGRWDVLVQWVAVGGHFPDNQPRDPLTLDAQLAFLWHEMNDVPPWNQTLPDIQKTITVEQATEVFEDDFEKAGTPNMPNRIKYARQVLEKYGGGMAQTNASTGEAVSDCPSASAGNSQFIDGFTVYNQCDSAWANKPYSSSTICDSGCGVVAMAMIVTALTGKSVLPPEVANYAASQGMYIPQVGSSWDIGKVVASKYNLKAQFIGANATKINDTLKNGGLVLVAGRGSLPFTSGGHFIVIRAVTADGKWRIGDSGHKNTSDKDWDSAQLLSGIKDGSVYAITK